MTLDLQVFPFRFQQLLLRPVWRPCYRLAWGKGFLVKLVKLEACIDWRGFTNFTRSLTEQFFTAKINLRSGSSVMWRAVERASWTDWTSQHCEKIIRSVHMYCIPSALHKVIVIQHHPFSSTGVLPMNFFTIVVKYCCEEPSSWARSFTGNAGPSCSRFTAYCTCTAAHNPASKTGSTFKPVL